MRASILLVACVVVTACHGDKPEDSTATDASSTATDISTTVTDASSTATDTGDPGGCAEDEVEILDHCYAQRQAPSISFPSVVAVADFDGDGALDVASDCKGEDAFFAICMCTLDTTTIRTDMPGFPGGYPRVQAGDYNADGRPEVYVAGLYAFAVFTLEDGALVLLDDRDFLGEPPPELGDEPFYPVFPIDLDQDGRAEVVTGSGENGFRLWRFDSASMSWVLAGERHALFGCGDIDDARVVDLDGDALPEFIAIGSHNNCDAGLAPGSGWNRVSIFTPSMGPIELVEAGDFPASLAARRFDLGEFNGDGILDLVVADHENLMFHFGHGDGTFDPDVLPVLDVAQFNGGPLAGDFDGDGLDDVVVRDLRDDVSVYRILVGFPQPEFFDIPESVGVPLFVGDLDQDGRADIVSSGPGQDSPLTLTLSGS